MINLKKIIEIFRTNKKSTQSADNLRNSSLMQNSGLPSTSQYNKLENLVKNNKKSAFSADSLGFRDDLVNPALTSVASITDQESLSIVADFSLNRGPAWNRAPETLMSKQGSDHPGPTINSLYNKNLDEKSQDQRPATEVASVLSAGPEGDRDTISVVTDAKKQESISELGRSVLSSQCPYCASKNFVKRGTRQKKGGKTQLYICRDCGRTFTPAWTKGRQHGWATVLEAISYYNIGFSLEQTCQIMKEKFQVEVQPSTIATWVEDNKEICSYHRMRAFAIKHFSPYEVMETCTLAHRQLYRFRYHHAKIKYIMEDDFKHYKFYPLKEFLDNVATETPHQYFSEGLRASEAPLKFSKTEMIVRSKENYATKLTELVFKGVSENKQRHEALQRFLIANDSVTVATEVPVYIRREDLAHMMTQLGFQLFKKTENLKSQIPISKSQTNSNDPLRQGSSEASQNPNDKKKNNENDNLEPMALDKIPKLITGHIDFLQIRNGSVHILDYKSNAAKERPIEQLTLYALALSRLTGLRLFYFKCAWFDEKDYFEFFPLHVVYKPGRGRKKIYTKEGVYNMNEKMTKMESLRPVVENRKTIIGTPNF